MRKIILPLLFTGMLISGATSCKKKTVNNTGNAVPPPDTGTSVFYGKVNGVLKSSTTTESQLIYEFGETYYGFAGHGTGFGWGATVISNAQPGQTYGISSEQISIGFNDNSANLYYLAETGTAQYVSHDTINNKITLNFQGTFVALQDETQSIQVTGGHLTMTYPQ